MSGPGDGKRKCSCLNNRCLRGNCSCFKANSFCSGCSCKDCKNIKDNKDEVDSQYQVYLKRNGPVVLDHPNVPLGGIPVPPGDGHKKCSCGRSRCLTRKCFCFKAERFCSGCKCIDCRNTEKYKDRVDSQHERCSKRKSADVSKTVNGCGCQKFGCNSNRCTCYKNNVRCTSICYCQGCTNGKNLRQSDTNTEPWQGSKDTVSNVLGKAVQTTGSDSNKRPRNQL